MPARIGAHRSAVAKEAAEDRAHMRRIVAQHAPLVALLRELYPAAMPALNASDREIGAFMGEQRLIERLEKLLQETRESAAPGELPTVIGG